jgi:hypothetical protein
MLYPPELRARFSSALTATRRTGPRIIRKRLRDRQFYPAAGGACFPARLAAAPPGAFRGAGAAPPGSRLCYTRKIAVMPEKHSKNEGAAKCP